MLVSDTRILLKDNWSQPIFDVIENDLVRNDKGDFSRVVQKEKSFTASLLVITADNGYSICVSAPQKFKAFVNNEIIWKGVEDIEVGDILAIESNTNYRKVRDIIKQTFCPKIHVYNLKIYPGFGFIANKFIVG